MRVCEAARAARARLTRAPRGVQMGLASSSTSGTNATLNYFLSGDYPGSSTAAPAYATPLGVVYGPSSSQSAQIHVQCDAGSPSRPVSGSMPFQFLFGQGFGGANAVWPAYLRNFTPPATCSSGTFPSYSSPSQYFGTASSVTGYARYWFYCARTHAPQRAAPPARGARAHARAL